MGKWIHLKTQPPCPCAPHHEPFEHGHFMRLKHLDLDLDLDLDLNLGLDLGLVTSVGPDPCRPWPAHSGTALAVNKLVQVPL